MKLVFYLILLFSLTTYAQENISVQMFEKVIEVKWDHDTTGTIMNWLVCYAQSADTSGFRFHNFMEGAPYEDMYEWFVHYGPYNFAYIWNKSFIFEEDYDPGYPYWPEGPGYIKIGILGQHYDSTWTTAKTYGPFPADVIGTPENILIQK